MGRVATGRPLHLHDVRRAAVAAKAARTRSVLAVRGRLAVSGVAGGIGGRTAFASDASLLPRRPRASCAPPSSHRAERRIW